MKHDFAFVVCILIFPFFFLRNFLLSNEGNIICLDMICLLCVFLFFAYTGI